MTQKWKRFDLSSSYSCSSEEDNLKETKIGEMTVRRHKSEPVYPVELFSLR